MPKASQAYKTMPDVICPTCGHTQPKMSRYPVPADLKLSWNSLQWIERMLMAALYLDHKRQPYRDWKPLPLAEYAHMTYRQVHNALRRLKACGWVHHVRRGVYRVSDEGLDRMKWVPAKYTQKKIASAQERGTEDTRS